MGGRKRRRVRCLDTGMEFDSLKEAAAWLGASTQRLADSMRRGFKCRGKMFVFPGAPPIVETRQECRHCQQRRYPRPRGLCYDCYKNPEIRNRYPTAIDNYQAKLDKIPLLPKLDHYWNSHAKTLCSCEQGWDGECPQCERTQRAKMVFVEEAS